VSVVLHRCIVSWDVIIASITRHLFLWCQRSTYIWLSTYFKAVLCILFYASQCKHSIYSFCNLV